MYYIYKCLFVFLKHIFYFLLRIIIVLFLTPLFNALSGSYGSFS